MAEQVRVLVIDDDLVIRNTFRRILEPQGYEVVIAASAQEGWDKAKEQCFDVAFVDVVMPKVDGIQAAEKLREICPDLKIVTMTAYAEDKYVKMALDSEINVFAELHKPFDIIEIDDIVKRATQ